MSAPSRPLRAMLDAALAAPTSGDVPADVTRLRDTLSVVLRRVFGLADADWRTLVAEAAARGAWDGWRSSGLAAAADPSTDPSPEVTRDLLAELTEELAVRGEVRAEPWEGGERQAAVASPEWVEGRRRREQVFAIERALTHLADADADGVAASAAALDVADGGSAFLGLDDALRRCADDLRSHAAVSPASRQRLMGALAGTPFAASAAALPVWVPPRPSAEEVVAAFRLEPLPVEGGLFRQTWKRTDGGTVVGTATFAALVAEPDSFSAMHRLTHDEIWHFYLGDPVQMVLLHPDGTVTRPVLGQDVRADQSPQVLVPAGTWMGAVLADGGEYALFGNTMAPGFESSCFVGGDREELVAAYPEAAADIERLTRPGAPTSMPHGL